MTQTPLQHDLSNMQQTEPGAGRSIPCNGKLISQLRKKLGWTQIELAKKAGFTERLIAKVEASQNIAMSTLQILAETLTEGGIVVSARELSVDPAALAREFILSMYQVERNVIDVNIDFMSPDVVIHFAGDPNIFPFAGTHIGIDAARRAFELFYSVMEPPKDHSDIENFQFVNTGHGALVWGETLVHPIGMPMPRPISLAVKMDFKDGLLVMFDDRFDTLEGAKHFAEAIKSAD